MNNNNKENKWDKARVEKVAAAKSYKHELWTKNKYMRESIRNAILYFIFKIILSFFFTTIASTTFQH
jgi:hypothetical protein